MGSFSELRYDPKIGRKEERANPPYISLFPWKLFEIYTCNWFCVIQQIKITFAAWVELMINFK